MKAYTNLLHKAMICGQTAGHPAITLTTDHAASSYGQPVALLGAQGRALGAADLLDLYGSCIVRASAEQLIMAADEQSVPPRRIQAIIDAWNQLATAHHGKSMDTWMENQAKILMPDES